MSRTFLRPDDLRDVVRDQFGADRRVVALDRLTGGSKKGVYRLRLDDQTAVVTYVWAASENYWPPSHTVPDDPFTDASGAELFDASHAALDAAGVRVPQLLMIDRARHYLDADIALVEDAGTLRLETLLERDPAEAAAPLAALGGVLHRMHTTHNSQYGKIAAIARGEASQTRRTEDIIMDRALVQLDAVAVREGRLADAHHRIASHVRALHSAVRPRQTYGLIHGELGPDHVLVTPSGEAVLIDFEGVAYFDVEWEHAFLELRFGEAYSALRTVELDADRLKFYRYAQILQLIDGPLRIADTDFPDRQWMLNLAEHNIVKALAAL